MSEVRAYYPTQANEKKLINWFMELNEQRVVMASTTGKLSSVWRESGDLLPLESLVGLRIGADVATRTTHAPPPPRL